MSESQSDRMGSDSPTQGSPAPAVLTLPPVPPTQPAQSWPPPDPASGRQIPWSGRRAVVATLAIVLVDGFVWGMLSWWAPAGNAYSAIGSLILTCLGVWLTVRRWGPPGIRAVLGGPLRRADVAIGVGVGLLILGVDTMIFAVSSLLTPMEGAADPQGWIDAAMVAAPVATLIAVVVTGPVAEEVLFRGLLFRGLRRRLGMVGAAVLSAAMFAALHPTDLSPGSVVLLVSTFASGLLFAAVTELRRSLMPAIVAHVVVNGIVSLLSGVPGSLPWVVEAGPTETVVAFDLEVGVCGTGLPDQLPEGSVTGWDRSAAVDCRTDHDFEVYDVGPLSEAASPYPGGREIAAAADEQCYQAFESYVGLPYADSALDYLAVVPSETAWAAGQRNAHCLLVDLERDTLEEPLAGSRR